MPKITIPKELRLTPTLKAVIEGGIKQDLILILEWKESVWRGDHV